MRVSNSEAIKILSDLYVLLEGIDRHDLALSANCKDTEFSHTCYFQESVSEPFEKVVATTLKLLGLPGDLSKSGTDEWGIDEDILDDLTFDFFTLGSLDAIPEYVEEVATAIALAGVESALGG